MSDARTSRSSPLTTCTYPLADRLSCGVGEEEEVQSVVPWQWLRESWRGVSGKGVQRRQLPGNYRRLRRGYLESMGVVYKPITEEWS